MQSAHQNMRVPILIHHCHSACGLVRERAARAPDCRAGQRRRPGTIVCVELVLEVYERVGENASVDLSPLANQAVEHIVHAQASSDVLGSFWVYARGVGAREPEVLDGRRGEA